MSYFPCDIPFMSGDELKGNGIRIPKDVPDTNVGDTIYRQAAIDAVMDELDRIDHVPQWVFDRLKKAIKQLPPVQPRDIPKKPNETIDRSWGIPTRQAVCPNCDAYLGMVHFIGDGDGKKIAYCESCGQAIDWTDWEDNDG